MKAIVFVFLLLLVDLSMVLGKECWGARCKVHENSPVPVDFPHLCGDIIMKVYKSVCDEMVWKRRRRRREIVADLLVQTKHEAQDFLSFRRRKRSSDATDVIEECCGEMCRKEELQEYC